MFTKSKYKDNTNCANDLKIIDKMRKLKISRLLTTNFIIFA